MSKIRTSWKESKTQQTFQTYKDRRGAGLDPNLKAKGLTDEQIRAASQLGLSYKQAQMVGDDGQVTLDDGTTITTSQLISSGPSPVGTGTSNQLEIALKATRDNFDRIRKYEEQKLTELEQELRDKAASIAGASTRVNKAFASGSVIDLVTDADLGSYAQKVVNKQSLLDNLSLKEVEETSRISGLAVSNQPGESSAAAQFQQALAQGAGAQASALQAQLSLQAKQLDLIQSVMGETYKNFTAQTIALVEANKKFFDDYQDKNGPRDKLSRIAEHRLSRYLEENGMLAVQELKFSQEFKDEFKLRMTAQGATPIELPDVMFVPDYRLLVATEGYDRVDGKSTNEPELYYINTSEVSSHPYRNSLTSANGQNREYANLDEDEYQRVLIRTNESGREEYYLKSSPGIVVDPGEVFAKMGISSGIRVHNPGMPSEEYSLSGRAESKNNGNAELVNFFVPMMDAEHEILEESLPDGAQKWLEYSAALEDTVGNEYKRREMAMVVQDMTNGNLNILFGIAKLLAIYFNDDADYEKEAADRPVAQKGSEFRDISEADDIESVIAGIADPEHRLIIELLLTGEELTPEERVQLKEEITNISSEMSQIKEILSAEGIDTGWLDEVEAEISSEDNTVYNTSGIKSKLEQAAEELTVSA